MAGSGRRKKPRSADESIWRKTLRRRTHSATQRSNNRPLRRKGISDRYGHVVRLSRRRPSIGTRNLWGKGHPDLSINPVLGTKVDVRVLPSWNRMGGCAHQEDFAEGGF